MTGGSAAGGGLSVSESVRPDAAGALYHVWGLGRAGRGGFCLCDALSRRASNGSPICGGFITGLAVLGFGAGSLIVAPVGTALISQIGVYKHICDLRGGRLGFLVVLTGALLRNPPVGWKTRGLGTPPGEWPPAPKSRGIIPLQRWRKNVFSFYLLWVVFLFWAGVGPDGDLPSGPDGPGARESQSDGRRGGVGPDVHSQRSWGDRHSGLSPISLGARAQRSSRKSSSS
jgi:hypothetical protein